MKYLSICSGIEAATVAWHPLDWTPIAFAETEAFPRAVLAHHYPSVPNWGDVNAFRKWPDADVDVLVGGTPCQSFSIAGLRGGMADPRGNLALVYLAIADRYRPEWLVWENVPGVLSSNGGRDFAAFIGGLEQLGYHAAWRVLDAQYVRVDGFARAVPQRRRRVFVVGHLGDWRRAAAVLFERESLSWHPAPRRQTGERPAQTNSARPTGGGGLGTDFDCDGGLIDYVPDIVQQAMSSKWSKGSSGPAGDEVANLVAHALRADGFDASEGGTGRGTPLVPVVAASLTRGAESAGKGGYAGRRQEDDVNLIAQPVSFDWQAGGGGNDQSFRGKSRAYNIVDKPGATRALISNRTPAIAFDSRQSDRDRTGPLDTDGSSIAVAIRNGDGSGCLDDRSLARSEDMPAGTMRGMREHQGRGPPHQRGLAGQHANEPATALPRMSHPGASGEDMLDLQREAQGSGLLQQAPSEVQKVGRSVRREDQPEHSTWAVRRLTPTECERLQGFPDGYTAVPYRGKPAADGPRYKALGNSMAVNCMRWLGRQIEMVAAL